MRKYEKTFLPLHIEFCRNLFNSFSLPYLKTTSNSASVTTSATTSNSTLFPMNNVIDLETNKKIPINMKITDIDPKLSFQALQALVDPNSVNSYKYL